jgi:hypothetical protein
VSWAFSDSDTGIDTLTVRISNAGGSTDSCSLRIAVFPAASQTAVIMGQMAQMAVRSGTVAGRSLLVAGHNEAPGYGGYAYLLFPSSDSNTARRRVILRAFGETLSEIEALHQVLHRDELTITYVPVTHSLEPQAGLRGAVETAVEPEWPLLQVYDYPRARALAARVGLRPSGTYLVALPIPLNQPIQRDSVPVLVVDLTQVPEPLVRTWVREFNDQLAQERPFEKGLRLRALQLRTILGEGAAALPDVRESVQDWVKYFEGFKP